jgi:LacI family transcriptional regulator
VSLVLNGASGNIRVSGVTRERVLAAAAALGYAPNHAARSLRRRSTNVIAFILPTLDNPYHAEVVSAAQAVARVRGFTIQVSPARDEQTELDALAALRGSGADGFIASGRSAAAIDEIRALAARGLKAVVLQGHSPIAGIPSVRVDLETGGYLARAPSRRSRAPPHRAISVTSFLTPSARARTASTATAARSPRPALRTSPACSRPAPTASPAAPRRSRPCSRARARSPPRSSRTTTRWRSAWLHALTRRGLRVPQDVALVGFDGIAIGKFTTPMLTTVAHPRDELGRRTIETVLDLIDGKRPARQDAVLPVELVVRESCGATDPARADDPERSEPPRRSRPLPAGRRGDPALRRASPSATTTK